MVSKLETIDMQCFQGKELDSGPTMGVSTQNPEMHAQANGIDQNVDLNRALWTLAEGTPRLKSA
jgi:hypothetical protein